MKTSGLFYFADEPQFATAASRAWIANYLRACRNHENGNAKRYLVRREKFGRYTVRLNYPDSPVAIIVTH